MRRWAAMTKNPRIAFGSMHLNSPRFKLPMRTTSAFCKPRAIRCLRIGKTRILKIPQQPVVAVSWFDAIAYCDWLSRTLGKQFRLPTEAEWERAARGGAEDEPFPWGDCAPDEIPDYANRWKTGPEPVGLYAPNPYGLFNVGDNVHEWCADWYDAGYYVVSPERNPQGPLSSSRRASRGGSWRHHIKVTQNSRALQHSPGIQIRRLRFSRGIRRGFPLGAVTSDVPS